MNTNTIACSLRAPVRFAALHGGHVQRIRKDRIFVAFTNADDARAWAFRVERFAHLSFVSDSSAFLTAAQISA